MDVHEKLNMKYNARVFLQVSAKGMSEVTQTAQFILRGLRIRRSHRRGRGSIPIFWQPVQINVQITTCTPSEVA